LGSGPVPLVGDGLATEALLDGFVAVRMRDGDCVGGGALAAGVKTFDVGTKPNDVDSGSGSDLNTVSKRARLKCDRSAKPR
jgi:hypothetical protein